MTGAEWVGFAGMTKQNLTPPQYINWPGLNEPLQESSIGLSYHVILDIHRYMTAR
jgi:hypothetical protein